MREEVEPAQAGVQEGVHAGVHEATQGGGEGGPLTAARLRELLHYDPLTGAFTWRVNRGRLAKAGDVAGSPHSDGYVGIKVDGRLYLAHRLACLYVTGVWPADKLDHMVSGPGCNAWKNLRPATHAQNMQNQRKARRDNKSGFLGVSPKRGRWVASIQVDHKSRHLGYFDSPELAHAAYLEAKARLHPFQTLV